MNCLMLRRSAIAISLATIGATAAALEQERPRMTNARLATLIKQIGEDIKGKDGFWRFSEGYTVCVITDQNADRMRIIVPVVEAADLSGNDLMRILQADFDSALDARYAVAKDALWSAFLHPLAALTDDEFFSGPAQVVNLAATYGKSYSSGALILRGGDSERLNRELYERIMHKRKSI
ncbi:MAG: hypothetical protein ACE5LB_01350 [Acidiferrobacterales bacterium]